MYSIFMMYTGPLALQHVTHSLFFLAFDLVPCKVAVVSYIQVTSAQIALLLRRAEDFPIGCCMKM